MHTIQVPALRVGRGPETPVLGRPAKDTGRQKVGNGAGAR